MKRFSIVCIFLISNCIGFSQKFSNIDYSLVETETKDPHSEFYYPYLTKRLLKNDTTLTRKEYQYLYFGNVYIKNYNPYGQSDLEKEFHEIYKNEQYTEAIPVGKRVLAENPVNINVTFKMLVCYHILEIRGTARIYAKKYFSMLDAIYNSGDGKSIETAYVVIKVDDEYQILSDLELQSLGQALLMKGPTDRLTIDTKNQKKIKGKKKIKELYFNVNKPFESLSNLLKDKE